MTISFFVPGTPKPQHSSTAPEHWKSQIALAAKAVLPSTPIEGPVNLEIQFVMPRPKCHYRKGGIIKGANIESYHTQKPNINNLEKPVMDCLTQLGFWKDDCQVACKHTEKTWSDASSPAGAWIHLEAI